MFSCITVTKSFLLHHVVTCYRLCVHNFHHVWGYVQYTITCNIHNYLRLNQYLITCQAMYRKLKVYFCYSPVLMYKCKYITYKHACFTTLHYILLEIQGAIAPCFLGFASQNKCCKICIFQSFVQISIFQ